MKKLAIVVMLVTFVLGGQAFANDPDNPFNNNIGIYLNTAATGSCGAIGAGVPFTVYVMVTDLTNPEVWGWEAKFSFENVTLLGETIHGSYINAGTRQGEYIVGLSDPLPVVNGRAILMDLQLIVLQYFNDPTLASNVYIDGIYFSLVDNGQPAYLAEPGGTGVALWQAIDGPETPQLSMNCGCAPVGVEENTWGTVKSLYR